MRILVCTACLLLLATVSPAKILITVNKDRAKSIVRNIMVMEDDGTGIHTILTGDRYLSAARWSPDGTHIVFHRSTHPGEDFQPLQIVMINADGTNERLVTQGASDGNPVFSPDGKSVLFNRSEWIKNEQKSSVNVIDLTSGQLRKIADFGVNFPDWSPDGKRIVYSDISTLGKAGSNLWIMDADGGRPRAVLPPLPLGVVLIDRGGYCRWSPNGKQIVYADHEFQFDPNVGFIPQAYLYFIYDLSTGHAQPLQIPKTYHPSALDWMDDGKSILFAAMEVALHVPGERGVHLYHIYQYDIATGRITQLSEHTWESPSLDWISDDVLPVSPQGKKKVTWGWVKHPDRE